MNTSEPAVGFGIQPVISSLSQKGPWGPGHFPRTLEASQHEGRVCPSRRAGPFVTKSYASLCSIPRRVHRCRGLFDDSEVHPSERQVSLPYKNINWQHRQGSSGRHPGAVRRDHDKSVSREDWMELLLPTDLERWHGRIDPCGGYGASPREAAPRNERAGVCLSQKKDPPKEGSPRHFAAFPHRQRN